MESNLLRRNITSIRISTHNLPIEHLRKFRIAKNNRLCLFFDTGALGSEEHVIMHCTHDTIVNLRTQLFTKLSEYSAEWQKLSGPDKFIYLLSAVDLDFTFYFSIFLDKIYKLTKETRKNNNVK